MQDIHLFADTGHDGAAYLYVSHAHDVRFADSEFRNLPKFFDQVNSHSKDPRSKKHEIILQKLVAAVVIDGGLSKFHNCNFTGMTGGSMAGAMVVTGGAGVEITEVQHKDSCVYDIF